MALAACSWPERLWGATGLSPAALRVRPSVANPSTSGLLTSQGDS